MHARNATSLQQNNITLPASGASRTFCPKRARFSSFGFDPSYLFPIQLVFAFGGVLLSSAVVAVRQSWGAVAAVAGTISPSIPKL